jgi:hypothetical protein
VGTASGTTRVRFASDFQGRERIRLAEEIYRDRGGHAAQKGLLGGAEKVGPEKPELATHFHTSQKRLLGLPDIPLSGAAAEHGAEYSLGHMQPEFRRRLAPEEKILVRARGSLTKWEYVLLADELKKRRGWDAA